MALTPEHKTKLKIKKILADRGVTYTMPATGGYGKSGVADFLACHKGLFVSIEAKGGRGKASALQLIWLEKVQNAGGIAMIVNEENLNELANILDEITIRSELK